MSNPLAASVADILCNPAESLFTAFKLHLNPTKLVSWEMGARLF